jgi:hypothetical protein
MVLKHAMWVHGNAAKIQDSGPWMNIIPNGWGTHFKMANQFHWIHIPFTLPIIIDGIRPQLSKALILYKTIGDTKITNIHIWDGAKRIWAMDDLSLQGNHSTAIDPSNNWSITPVTVYYGMGYSLGVQFGATKDNTVPELVIYGAGADLTTP